MARHGRDAMSAFETDAMIWAITYKWETYGRKVHSRLFMLYGIILIFFTIAQRSNVENMIRYVDGEVDVHVHASGVIGSFEWVFEFIAALISTFFLLIASQYSAEDISRLKVQRCYSHGLDSHSRVFALQIHDRKCAKSSASACEITSPTAGTG